MGIDMDNTTQSAAQNDSAVVKFDVPQHTLGPWTAHDLSVDHHIPVSAPYGDTRACIAQVGFAWRKTNTEPTREEAEANARKNAAAPHMLAALRVVAAAPGEITSNARQIASAAIAMAVG